MDFAQSPSRSKQANQRIRMLTTDGQLVTIAGTGTGEFSNDGGLATSAGLWWPDDVAIDSNGHVLVADGMRSPNRTAAQGTVGDERSVTPRPPNPHPSSPLLAG